MRTRLLLVMALSVLSLDILAATPVLTLTPNLTSVNLSTNASATIEYTVTNTSGKALPGLTMEADYLASPLTQNSISSSSTCTVGQTLAVGASCVLVTQSQSGATAGTESITPRVCAFNGVVCSQLTTPVRVTVSSGSDPAPTTGELTVETDLLNQHLQYRALTVENTSDLPAKITGAPTISAGLSDKVAFCAAGDANCVYTSTCAINTDIAPGASCLLWFRSLDQTSGGTDNAIGTASGEITVETNSADNADTVFTTNFSLDLYAGGTFSTAGGVTVNYIAAWDGSSWAALSTGVDGFDPAVFAITAWKGDLYAGGLFSEAGEASAAGVAKWNGSTWSALGSGIVGAVEAFASTTNYLYIGGDITTAGGSPVNEIARWDDSSWSALGSGVNNTIASLSASANEQYIYVAGRFTTAGGVASPNQSAQWDSSSSAWSSLSAASFTGTWVRAILSTDTGVYAAGTFTAIGGVAAANIALYDTSSGDWSPLGSGLNQQAFAIARHGDDIYAGGQFTTAGGVAANNIASWNGSTWSALGAGVGASVRSILSHGNDVYVGGSFTTAGGNAALRIARWDGSSWSAVGSGLNGTAQALTAASSLTLAAQ